MKGEFRHNILPGDQEPVKLRACSPIAHAHKVCTDCDIIFFEKLMIIVKLAIQYPDGFTPLSNSGCLFSLSNISFHAYA